MKGGPMRVQKNLVETSKTPDTPTVGIFSTEKI